MILVKQEFSCGESFLANLQLLLLRELYNSQATEIPFAFQPTLQLLNEDGKDNQINMMFNYFQISNLTSECKDSIEFERVYSKGDQSWVFFGRNDAKAKTLVLWPPHVKSWLIGKDSDAGRDWGQEEKGMTEDEMAGWHHWLDGPDSEWTLGDGDE